MKYFPVKTAILCFLIPPLLYIATLSVGTRYLETQYTQKIQNILIGDAASLLDGAVSLEEQVAMNIDRFLSEDFKVQKALLDIEVQVTTHSGKIIYPVFIDVSALENDIGQRIDSGQQAKQNYKLLNDGLEVIVKPNFDFGSRLGNVILFFYFGISALVFFVCYRAASVKAKKERMKNAQTLSELKEGEAVYRQVLDELQHERQGLFENIKALNAKYEEDREKAKINEEEMFEEIISLEEKLKSFIDLKKKRENEISELKTQVQDFERRKGSKSKRNDLEFQEKRFVSLYKNIQMHPKALTGFISLSEEQQIKAEEVVLQLNHDPRNVTVKRKVFSGKKHKTACFEVLFAYNGRLYFNRDKNNIIQVLVIGTKNTQVKDMEFLHNL